MAGQVSHPLDNRPSLQEIGINHEGNASRLKGSVLAFIIWMKMERKSKMKKMIPREGLSCEQELIQRRSRAKRD